MGHFYQLWIASDVILLFLSQFNIALEFITTKNMDHVLAEWVYDHIKETIKEHMAKRINQLFTGEELTKVE